jgi:SOS-response transcriptional repressor LexA
MSIEALNQAIKTEGLSPTRKLILVILANYADEHGSCYPSYKHIAKIVGLKDSKGVQRVIKEFEQSGLLRIEHRRTVDGGQTSNRYHLTLDPSPIGAVTPLPPALTPPNTKEDTKEDTYSVGFKQFWKVYPRRVGKFEANKAFVKLISKISSVKEKQDCFLIELINNTRNFAWICKQKSTESQFIPHAATFLNKRRYEDYAKTKEHVTTIKSINKIAG